MQDLYGGYYFIYQNSDKFLRRINRDPMLEDTIY